MGESVDMAMTPKTYQLIEKLEARYGSMKNVKNDDPDYRKLRILLTGKFVEYRESDVVKALRRGHSDNWAMEHYNITQSSIDDIRAKYVIRKVPIFRVKLSNGIYATSTYSVMRFLDVKSKLGHHLKANGLSMTKKPCVWGIFQSIVIM